MDRYAALDVLFSGRICAAACLASLVAAIMVRLDTIRKAEAQERRNQEVLRLVASVAREQATQGDELSRVSCELDRYRLDADHRRTPTPQRLGIDVRGRG